MSEIFIEKKEKDLNRLSGSTRVKVRKKKCASKLDDVRKIKFQNSGFVQPTRCSSLRQSPQKIVEEKKGKDDPGLKKSMSYCGLVSFEKNVLEHDDNLSLREDKIQEETLKSQMKIFSKKIQELETRVKTSEHVCINYCALVSEIWNWLLEPERQRILRYTDGYKELIDKIRKILSNGTDWWIESPITEPQSSKREISPVPRERSFSTPSTLIQFTLSPRNQQQQKKNRKKTESNDDDICLLRSESDNASDDSKGKAGWSRSNSESDTWSQLSSPRHIATINDVKSIKLYEIVGKGSTGVVYRGMYGPYTVACKSIYKDFLSNEMTEEIEQMLGIMSTLQRHCNIVYHFGFDIYSDKTRYYLMMEYFSVTLHSFIERERECGNTCIEYMVISEFMFQIANGVKFLHNLVPDAIIHCDLKSENIFLHLNEKHKRDSVVKIGDFSEMRLFTTEKYIQDNRNLLNRDLFNRGTTEFMAPEMITLPSSKNCSKKKNNKSTNPYGPKVDIWAIGMILYEMLTLDIPYRNNDVGNLDLPSYISSGNKPRWPDGVFHQKTKSVLFHKLLEIFNMCTEVDVEKRVSATILVQEIQQVKQGFNLSGY